MSPNMTLFGNLTFDKHRQCSLCETVSLSVCLLLCYYKYASGDQIKKTEMDGANGTTEGSRDAYRVLVGKTKGKRPLGRPKRR